MTKEPKTPEPAPPPDPGELEEMRQMEEKAKEEAELIEQELEEEARNPVLEATDLKTLRMEKRRLTKPAKKKPPLKLFPPPFTVNFHPDHKDIRGRPPAFWDYWNKVYQDPELRDRIVVYIYRIWPVMVEGKRQVTKAYEPFPFEDLVKLYGCGDYMLKLNDAAGSRNTKKTITNCKVTMVGNYNLTEFPPLLDLEGLDIHNPHNERYIRWCESRGIKVPGRVKNSEQEEEDEEVSKVTKVLLDQYMQLTDKIVKDDPKRAAADSGVNAVAPMVEVIKTATEGANQIMQKAYDRTAQLQQQQQNPTEMISNTVKALKEILPKPEEGTSQLVSSYLQAMQLMSEKMMTVNTQYIDRMVQMTHERMAQSEAQMTKLLEALAARQANPAPAAAGNGQNLKDMLKEMVEFKEQLREIMGVEDERKSGGWTEYLPDILKALTVLGTTVAAAMHNFAVAKTGQGQPVAVTPPQQQPAPVPVAAEEQQTQSQEQDMLSQYHNLLSMLRPSLLKSFMDGESGSDYAARLIELTDAGLFGATYSGRQIYDAILEAGEMSVSTVIKTFPPIWDVVKQTPQKWERFLHEFFEADKIWEQEEQQQVIQNPATGKKSKAS